MTYKDKAQLDDLSLLLSNDIKGIKAIYDRFFPRIQRMITKNGGTLEDAEDIFQEALIIIYQKAKSPLFLLNSSFYTFLYGICRNLWGSRLQRKYRKDLPIINDDAFVDVNDIEEVLMQKELETIFWSNFEKLCDGCKKVLSMSFEGNSMEIIRATMGYGSVNYTRKRKFKCKEKLIKKIKLDARYKELMQLKKTK